MTAPTARLRKEVYLRDGNRCVDCGTSDNLSIQHREASGMGGRGKKAPPLTASDLLTLCLPDNEACEAEGQSRALALGYKIRRNRGQITADRIPIFDRNTKFWYQLNRDGSRTAIQPALAAEYLFLAGNLEIEERRT